VIKSPRLGSCPQEPSSKCAFSTGTKELSVAQPAHLLKPKEHSCLLDGPLNSPENNQIVESVDDF
jgi:hypothetical protein